MPSPVAEALESPGERRPARPLRAAILGTGGVAHLHARALADLEGVQLVAAADPSEANLAAFSDTYAVPLRYGSLADLLRAADVDVLHICTPPGGHADQAAAAFAAGAHVVVEKPAALSLDQLDDMMRAAHEAERELAVVFQQRSGSAAARIKELLDAGALGRPLTALCQTHWYRTAEYFDVPWRGTWAAEGGGTTLSHASHQIDLLAYLLGEWRSVRSTLWRLEREIEPEDLSHASLVFESGAVASVLSTVLAPRQSSLLRIDTEHATIELEHLYGHDHTNWHITPAPHVDTVTAESWRLPEQEVASGHDALLAEIYSSLGAGRGMPAVVAHPSRALEIVTGIYASASRDRWISRSDLSEPGLRGPLEAPIIEGRPGEHDDGAPA